MSFRRLRGLWGTALTWGATGALIAVVGYLVRVPWPRVQVRFLDRLILQLMAFAGAGALWGSVCGLAFGLAILATARRARFEELGPKRFILWGALGGAAFPLLIYVPAVILRGRYAPVPLYSMLTAISALLGAGFGYIVFTMARRAPQSPTEMGVLGEGPLTGDLAVRQTASDLAR
jgi:hypothetical protein